LVFHFVLTTSSTKLGTVDVSHTFQLGTDLPGGKPGITYTSGATTALGLYCS